MSRNYEFHLEVKPVNEITDAEERGRIRTTLNASCDDLPSFTAYGDCFQCSGELTLVGGRDEHEFAEEVTKIIFRALRQPTSPGPGGIRTESRTIVPTLMRRITTPGFLRLSN